MTGFFRGFSALFRGAKFVMGTPALWPMAAVPVFVWGLIVSAIAGVSGFMFWRSVQGNITLTQGITHAIAALVGIFFAFLLATALAQPFSGPALDVLVERRRRALGLPRAPSLSFGQTLPRSLGVTLLGLVVSFPLVGGLWVLGLAVPVLAPVVLVLKFLVVSIVVAWDFLDYPCAIEGMRIRDRISFIRSNFGLVFGFGVAAALVLMVPCIGLVVLTFGVVGATDVLFFGGNAASRYPPSS